MTVIVPRQPKRPAAHRASDDVIRRVREALLKEAGVDLSPDEVARVVDLAQEQSALDDLGGAMARMPQSVSPATARAAQATENSWKAIASEFGLLSSTEVAGILGSSSSKTAMRSLANDMRTAGRLLAVRRLNRYLYPAFQFDRARGRVLPVVAPLLKLARDRSWNEEDVVLWMVSPTTYLEEGSRPVDHIEDVDLLTSVADRAWSVDW